MARFYGKVGFVQSNVETRPGVYKDVVTELRYKGDVLNNSRRLDGEKINQDFSVGNRISIVADAYANNTFFAMKYIEWMGTLWVISNVDVQSPRLILSLGGVYNGPKATQTPVAP
jgi:hypothetical protein